MPRATFRKHVAARDAYVKARADAKQARYDSGHPRNSDRLQDIKVALGCVTCGYSDLPDALEWDHRDPRTKLFNLSAANSHT